MEHHAYLLLGERRETEAFLAGIFEDTGIRRVGNADVVELTQETFGVDDARALGARAAGKAFSQKKVFVIKTEKITPEAQNALLKTLEDPVPNTHFFIIAREESIFLPTLLSRLHVLRLGGEIGEDKLVKKFLDKTPAKRMEFAKDFEGSLSDFLDALLLSLKERKVSLESLRKVANMRVYARDPSVQSRLILEHLALVL